jgi:hypothetical protein
MARYTGNGDEIYEKVHWGYKANRKVQAKIPGLSKKHPIIEMGLLTELHIDPFDGVDVPMVSVDEMTDEAAEKPDMEFLGEIAVDQKDYMNNSLVFDPKHRNQRLYNVLSPSSKRDAKRFLWRKGVRTYSLHDLAKMVGGPHADRNDYANVRVQPLGRLYYVTYYTLKEDENGEPSPSKYIHRMGEEGGIEPILAVSNQGDLFIAGGTYTCEIGGITR